MKFLLGLLLLSGFILSAAPSVSAQDEDLDKLSFEETPLVDQESPYFVIGGGFIATWHFSNFDEIHKNTRLDNFASADMKAPVFLSGGAGFVAIPYLPNFRVGVFAAAGGKQVSATSSDTIRTLNYSLGYTGGSIDYAVQVTKKLTILPGLNIGGGTITIETGQTVGKRDYTTELGTPTNTNNFYGKMTGGFAFVQPNLNIEYSVTSVSLLRINAGYMLGFMGAWRADRAETEIVNVPKEINSNGLTFQVGLFLGLFN
ncbi:hypothetical protein MASR2M18_05660 [Ignavibacteria bacterium]|nr:hypothetical protein [Bacteroidota bacterium]MCZ2132085.1 hypothetical protein [Bacteroidota bacterium]